jgi:hypothetical protein
LPPIIYMIQWEYKKENKYRTILNFVSTYGGPKAVLKAGGQICPYNILKRVNGGPYLGVLEVK